MLPTSCLSSSPSSFYAGFARSAASRLAARSGSVDQGSLVTPRSQTICSEQENSLHLSSLLVELVHYSSTRPSTRSSNIGSEQLAAINFVLVELAGEQTCRRSKFAGFVKSTTNQRAARSLRCSSIDNAYHHSLLVKHQQRASSSPPIQYVVHQVSSKPARRAC